MFKLTPAVLVSTPECVFKFINNIFNSGVGFNTGYCSLSMRHHTWLHFYRAFPGNEDLLTEIKPSQKVEKRAINGLF